MPDLVFTLFMGVCLVSQLSAADTPAKPPRLSAAVGVDGSLRVYSGKTQLCNINAALFEKDWQHAGASCQYWKSVNLDSTTRKLTIRPPSGAGQVNCEAAFSAKEDGCEAEYVLTPSQDVMLNALYAGASFDIPTLAGGKWTADDKSGTFPNEFKDVHLFNATVSNLALDLPTGENISFAFPSPTQILLQDDRKWGQTFSLRMGPQPGDAATFKKGETNMIPFRLTSKGGIDVTIEKAVTITAGKEWIPLKLDLDIAQGSALDFSSQGFHDAPAGKDGWVVVTPDGHFAFEKSPKKPRRFYGVNLCFSALYITHENADRLAERLQRLGYNTVRIHHYEGELASSQATTTAFNTNKLDQFDYLMAAFIKRGIYLTTDLYVSRPVKNSEIGLDKNVYKEWNDFKVLVPVHDKSFESFKAFAKALLEHVNPYTGRSYAQEPALAWISLINEGNLSNFLGAINRIPQWKTAWNEWLVKRYKDRAALAAAWGNELKADEDPAGGNVALPGGAWEQTIRARDAIVFLEEVELDMFNRIKDFLRKDLRVRALLTNRNGWTNFAVDQFARAPYDYADDHFYVDHPQFIDKDWQLPSRCPNKSPISDGAWGGRGNAFVRFTGKPFTISEYNYSAPGRFRGVGGILTGAMGALQNWDIIWRFAYSHNRDSEMKGGALNYFDMSCDPLGQAAERAAICLFLRGDMKPAGHLVNIVVARKDLDQLPAKLPPLSPAWNWVTWLAQVGVQVVENPGDKTAGDAILPVAWAVPADKYAGGNVQQIDPYKADDAAMVQILKKAGVLDAGNPTDPAKKMFRSDTGEITIDAAADTMTLDTEKTAGAYIPAGKSVSCREGVSLSTLDTDATVWVSSLDDKRISKSGRLLVSHLTDVQNTGIRYAEPDMQTLLEWGKLPHLVRAGKATAAVKLGKADQFKVWALRTNGQRIKEIPVEVKDGVLTFTMDIGRFAADEGAVFCYEIAMDEKR